MSLYLATTKVGKDLKGALRSISDFDNDFNGENGLEYLWEEVWEENGYEDEEDYDNACEEAEATDKDVPELKYESNMDYLLGTLEGTDEEIANQFIEQWMEHDSNYYEEYDFTVYANKNGKVSFIALATMS